MKTIFIDAQGKNPEEALAGARSKMVSDIMEINKEVDSAFSYGITNISHNIVRTSSAKIDEKFYASIFVTLNN